jgi:hypothetical protein
LGLKNIIEDKDMPEYISPDTVPGKPPYLGSGVVGIKLKHMVVIEDRRYIPG